MEAVAQFIGLNNLPGLFLHIDELDQGLSQLDVQRSQMLVGLVLAARDVRCFLQPLGVNVNPIVCLRSDIWGYLQFSDKNKITQTSRLLLEWDRESLLGLVNARVRALTGNTRASWRDTDDGHLMRGSQQKWDHILARTVLRPRDVIQFLNNALKQVKERSGAPSRFTNKDITNARGDYSAYLKAELDDELTPHWDQWGEALQTLSCIRTMTFDKKSFQAEYEKRCSQTNRSSDQALQTLFRFSVIGYEQRSGYGGASWVFQYTNPESQWDQAATRFKVHLGLKEFARLREERA